MRNSMCGFAAVTSCDGRAEFGIRNVLSVANSR